jgi:hypothetical protein
MSVVYALGIQGRFLIGMTGDWHKRVTGYDSRYKLSRKVQQAEQNSGGKSALLIRNSKDPC